MNGLAEVDFWRLHLEMVMTGRDPYARTLLVKKSVLCVLA
jgi:hypothetical protein